MTQLIVEGFGTYGISNVPSPTVNQNDAIITNMKSGAWADVHQGAVVTPLPWAAQDSALYAGDTFKQAGGDTYRRVIPTPADELVFSFRFAISALPTNAAAARIITFNNGSNSAIYWLTLETTGVLTLRAAGTAPPVASTQNPVIVASSAQHLEMRIKITTGEFDLYVDGTQVIQATGLSSTQAGPIAQFTMLTYPIASPPGGGTAHFTDLIVRNTLGLYNNGIMGDRRVATLLVNSDDNSLQGWQEQPLQRFGTGILANTTANAGAISVAATTDTDFGSGDFTVEGNFRFQSLPSGSNRATLFAKWSTTNNQRSYVLYLGGPTLDNGMLTFQCSTDGLSGTVTTLLRWPWLPDTGRWYHVAVCRVGGVLRLFIDGVQQGTDVADANTYFAGSSFTCLIGLRTSGGFTANWGLDGWADEFRITKGVGRYTANFAPPTDKFPRGALDPDWASVTWLSGFDNGMFDDSSFGRTLTAGGGNTAPLDPTTVTPNDLLGAYMTLNKKLPPFEDSFIEAALVPATGLFTLTGQPANGETVRLGTKDGVAAATYTFKTVLAAAFDVLIGASSSDSIDNLNAAINKGPGEGTLYGTGTTANFDATSERMPTIQILARATLAGTGGNAIVTTDTVANGSWGAGTLAGGANIPGPSQFGFSRPPNNTTVIDSVTLVNRSWKTDSGPATVVQSFVGPGGAKTDGTPKSISTSPTYYFDMFELDPDTGAPVTPTTLVNGKVRVNRTV